IAVCCVKVLYNSNTMLHKVSVPRVVMHGSGSGMPFLSIYLKDSPLPVLADQEIRDSVLSAIWPVQPRLAIGEEEHSYSVKCLSNPNFGLRCEVEITPRVFALVVADRFPTRNAL